MLFYIFLDTHEALWLAKTVKVLVFIGMVSSLSQTFMTYWSVNFTKMIFRRRFQSVLSSGYHSALKIRKVTNNIPAWSFVAALMILCLLYSLYHLRTRYPRYAKIRNAMTISNVMHDNIMPCHSTVCFYLPGPFTWFDLAFILKTGAEIGILDISKMILE